MILKFFIIFISSFFAGSMVLLVFARKYADSFTSKSKRPVISGGLLSAGISGTGYLTTLISDHLFTVYWMIALTYFLFGLVYVLFFHNRYFKKNINNKEKIVFAEILFAVSIVMFTIVMFSALQYFLADKSFLFFPLLISTLFFFVPLVVLHTFNAAYNIPVPEYASWQYPLHNPLELPDENSNDKLLVIAFEIAKKDADNKRTNFRAKGPTSMPLGDLYYHFMNDYNDLHSETTIEYMAQDDTAYDWSFRLKKKWFQGTKILDPQLSIKDNKIKENSIIICDRILKDQLIVP